MASGGHFNGTDTESGDMYCIDIGIYIADNPV